MAKTCAELTLRRRDDAHSRTARTNGAICRRATDITSLVVHDLANRVQVALDSGVERERIVLDPGFGFGKNFEENYPLLAHLDGLQTPGFPLLAGTSRKSFVGRTVGKRRGSEDAPPPISASTARWPPWSPAFSHGAHIVRVHDVSPAVEAAAVADEVLAAMAT